MKYKATLRPFCASRITPIASVIALAAFANSAFGSAAGQAAINAEVANIPTVKAGTTVAKLKSNDLLLALCLALENPANAGLTPADLAISALEARKDKDKLASSVIGTTIATVNAGNDATTSSLITVGVFSQAGLSAKKGQPAALAGGLTAITDSSIGSTLGGGIALAFSGSSTDLQNLLVGTVNVTGKSTGAISSALVNFIDGLFDANEVPAADRSSFITTTAEKVGKKNPQGAGAFYGGLVANNPNGDFDDDSELQSLATAVVANKKLSKAIGEILGNTLEAHSDKPALTANLIAGQKLPNQSLIIQGVLRAGDTADVAGVLGTALPGISKANDRIKLAGIVAVGNGDDTDKLKAIVTVAATGQTIPDRSKIGIAVINSIGTDTPDAAQSAMAALYDTPGGVGDALTFGLSVVPKVKSYAAAGAASAEVAIRNGNEVNTAAQLMGKAKKAATDIAQRISALGSVVSKPVFATQLANASPKFVQNIAVGTSITDPSNAAQITANVVTHNPTGDKKAISTVGNIAGAVAYAVDAEQAAAIAVALGDLSSDKGSAAGKPIRIQSFNSLAKALAKALQSKPGVKTTNRMDELGELAAALTKTLLAELTNSKSREKAVKAIGKTIAGVLSKKSVNETKDLLADTSEAADIAGSMAQVVAESSLSQADKDALIGTNDVTKGAIGKGVLPKSGKKGSTDYNNTISALQSIDTANPPATANKFENGSVNDPETDTKNG